MEEEARTLLRSALRDEVTAGTNLAEAIRARFVSIGGVDLALPRREPIREPPKPGR
jgi:plasmid stability protein